MKTRCGRDHLHASSDKKKSRTCTIILVLNITAITDIALRRRYIPTCLGDIGPAIALTIILELSSALTAAAAVVEWCRAAAGEYGELQCM